MKHTYQSSGVDIKKGEELVEEMKEMVSSTYNDAVINPIGGFGGMFSASFKEMEDPVLVSSVDGVGTKLIVAFRAGVYDTVGQDLVNHCVNDIAVCGADPLFFLDYFSTGKLEKRIGLEVIRGFVKACKENGAALIGGETAEMPDIYKEGEFDLAGTIVGVADRAKLMTGERIHPGYTVLGIESNGLHTNGYSLARKVLLESFSLDTRLDDHHPELHGTLADELLKIHRSYLPFIRKVRKYNRVAGLAHITGGGLISNTMRVLPEGLDLEIDWSSWKRPAIFTLIQKTGSVPEEDMRRTFNLGIGLTVICHHSIVSKCMEEGQALGWKVFEIGTVK